MEKDNVLNAVKAAREKGKKLKFRQTFDFILNLKDLDLKNPDQQVETFVTLHYDKGKASKVCGLVGPELMDQAKDTFDRSIRVDDFAKIAKDKKALKKLANEFDFFVAQANIMAKVAASFGKVLGPRGKMPNPNAGCVVPPNANLKQLNEKLLKVICMKAKTQPMIQIPIGHEEMKDEEIADNLVTAYNALIHSLPSERNNVKNISIKLTMGKPVKITEKGDIIKDITESKKVVSADKNVKIEEVSSA
jgi:large subunit ribosomal protein L1